MPYPVLQDSILEISIEAIFNGQQTINLFHYRYEGPGSLPDGRQTALDAIAAFSGATSVKPAYQAVVTNRVENYTIFAQWISTIRYAYVIDPTGPFNGVLDDDPLPVNSGASITKRGDFAGRQYIGTTHIANVPAVQVLASRFTPAYVADLQTLADEIAEPLVVGGGLTLQPVLFNRANPLNSRDILEAFPQDTVRVNRRRTVGVGA